MKITLLVLNNFANDARIHKEAITLAKAGHSVTIFALWQSGLPESETQSGYRVIRLRLRSRAWKNRCLGPVVKYLEFALILQRTTDQHPSQVYHANDANTLPAAWLAASRNKAKLIYDAHELETGRNFEGSRIAGLYQKIWALPEKLFIHKADVVITVSDSIAARLADLYGISKPHLVLNCPEKQQASSSDRLRQMLGIPSNLHIILYQGVIAPGRGIEAFLDAIQEVPNAAGVLLGDGPLLERLKSKLRNKTWQRIYLPGKVPLEELPSHTASAKLGVVLIEPTCESYRLSLPNKLFEYIQAGLPVIGSNIPEIARIIQEYQIGLVVDPSNSLTIAAGIQQLINNPKQYDQIKENVYRAAEIFNWENESQKLLQLYRELE